LRIKRQMPMTPLSWPLSTAAPAKIPLSWACMSWASFALCSGSAPDRCPMKK